MRSVIDPAQTKDAAMTVTSMAKEVAARARLRLCILTEPTSSETSLAFGTSPSWTGRASCPGRPKNSGVLKFLANRTAVRSTARTSCRSPIRVTPMIADEFGETSSIELDGTAILGTTGWVRVSVFIADPISFLSSDRQKQLDDLWIEGRSPSCFLPWPTSVSARK